MKNHVIGVDIGGTNIRVALLNKRNNTPCDIVLKDISTVNGNPENLFKWHYLVMSMVKNY